jgi:pimeloyl-ACP methyl ester carboxylesterase
VLASLGAPLVTAPAHAKTLYFPHLDAKFLYRFQRDGGAAVVPEQARAEGAALPLVVFLHGTNPTSETHMWLGGGGRDLRPLAKRLIDGGEVAPFVLAAPSQTKNAGLAATVWEHFDLNAFVDDVVRATDGLVRIDRKRVVLAGHSGAGCNPRGGLASDFWSAGSPLPLALVSIDPCLDRKMGGAFARRPTEVPLLLWWQPAIWVRQPAKFQAALLRDKPEQRVDRLRELPPMGPNPHEAILPVAFESALRELLGTSKQG